MKRLSAVHWVLLATIAIGVLLRSSHLMDPYVVDFHAWRQADSAGFVHGYLRESMNPFDPSLDRFPCKLANERFGRVEAELPLHGYLAALPLRLLGMDFPPAPFLRVIAILFFVGACLYLFALARELGADERESTAVVLAFVLFPVSIFFTRTPQPDGPALMLSLAMLFHLERFLGDDTQRRHGVWAAFFGACLLLIKVSNAFMGLPAAYLVLRRRGVWGALTSRSTWLVAAGMVLPALAWSLYARDLPWSFGVWNADADSKFSTRAVFVDPKTWSTLAGRVVRDLFTWPGLALVALGLTSIVALPRVRVAAVWLAGVLLFIVATLKGNLMHVYYQLPLVLPAALLAGVAIRALLDRGWLARAALAVSFVLVALTARSVLWQGDGRDKAYFAPRTQLLAGIELVAQHVPARERFVSTDRHPALFYNARHQGWFVEPVNRRTLEACLAGSKARYVLVAKSHEKHIDALNAKLPRAGRVELVERREGFALYRAPR